MNVVPGAEGEKARESGYGQISQFGNLLLRIPNCIIGPFLTHGMESTDGPTRYGLNLLGLVISPYQHCKLSMKIPY